MQDAGGIDHQPQLGPEALNVTRGLGDTGLVGEVEGRGAAASETQRLTEAGLGGEAAEQRPANTARRSDDDGKAARVETQGPRT